MVDRLLIIDIFHHIALAVLYSIMPFMSQYSFIPYSWYEAGVFVYACLFMGKRQFILHDRMMMITDNEN
jgi:hypothetical protein